MDDSNFPHFHSAGKDDELWYINIDKAHFNMIKHRPFSNIAENTDKVKKFQDSRLHTLIKYMSQD